MANPGDPNLLPKGAVDSIQETKEDSANKKGAKKQTTKASNPLPTATRRSARGKGKEEEKDIDQEKGKGRSKTGKVEKDKAKDEKEEEAKEPIARSIVNADDLFYSNATLCMLLYSFILY